MQSADVQAEQTKQNLRRHDAADVVMHQHMRLVCRTHQIASFVQDTSTGRIIINRRADLVRQPVEEDVSKFVTASDGLVVHHRHGCQPSWLGIVCEDEELSSGDGFVGNVKGGLLDISSDDPRTLHVQRHYGRREALQ